MRWSLARKIGTSSHNALRLHNIIVSFRSRDHSFAMDFIEVVSQTAPAFGERKLISLENLDHLQTSKKLMKSL